MHVPLDPSTRLLHDLRLSGSFYVRCELGAPWGLQMPACGIASFHFVARGAPWLLLDGETVPLGAGDLVLLPHGSGHALVDAVGTEPVPVQQVPHEPLGANASMLRYGGEGATSLIICGGVTFESTGMPLVELLPPFLRVRTVGDDADPGVAPVLELMAAELARPAPGTATIVTRLADILVVHAVRLWLERSPEASMGWARALRDPAIGRALVLVHTQAEKPWTVASLAAAVGMSRAVFSERFVALVGQPPIQYLTQWRMRLASDLIRQGALSLGEVADRLGYDSDASFSRAFKRHVGVPPGQFRRSASA